MGSLSGRKLSTKTISEKHFIILIAPIQNNDHLRALYKTNPNHEEIYVLIQIQLSPIQLFSNVHILATCRDK